MGGSRWVYDWGRGLSEVGDGFLTFVTLITTALSLSSYLDDSRAMMRCAGSATVANFSLKGLNECAGAATNGSALVTSGIGKTGCGFCVSRVGHRVCGMSSLPAGAEATTMLTAVDDGGDDPVFVVRGGYPRGVSSTGCCSDASSVSFSRPQVIHMCGGSLGTCIACAMGIGIRRRRNGRFG